jgi:Xaa-Pro aminopeptidase
MLKDWHRPLEAGMVFTLEPGVYFPGEIGIRIEDDVLLSETGPRRLTNAPRELLVL